MSRARARHGDPTTSHAAAASVGELTENQRSVMFMFRLYSKPMLDEELVDTYKRLQKVPAYHLPRQSDSGIRSRRAELSKMSLLTEGEKKRMSTGRLGRTWSIATPTTSESPRP